MHDTLDTSAFGMRRPSSQLARMIGITSRQPDTWLGKRIAFFLRRLALRRVDGPVDVEAMGVNLRLYPFNNVCETRILFTPQYFDEPERHLLASRVREGFSFIDIGANIGGYALAVAAAAGPGAHILAVEPQPDIFERLVYNIGQNPHGTVKAIACAIADHDGELTLFVDGANRGQSSLKFVSSEGGKDSALKVPSKTLLTLIREEGLSRVDAVKIDVEGAEDIILIPFLRDAPQALWPKLLLIESIAGRWDNDILGMLTARGYRRALETRRNVAFERD